MLDHHGPEARHVAGRVVADVRAGRRGLRGRRRAWSSSPSCGAAAAGRARPAWPPMRADRARRVGVHLGRRDRGPGGHPRRAGGGHGHAPPRTSAEPERGRAARSRSRPSAGGGTSGTRTRAWPPPTEIHIPVGPARRRRPAVRQRDPQLLGAAAGGQGRRHPGPDQPPALPGDGAGHLPRARAPSTAASSTPAWGSS